MKLTGNEKWIVAGKQGAEVYACDGNGFYPIVEVEMDCGLVKVDVCGAIQINDVTHCDIKIEFDGDVIEDIYETI